MADEAEADTLDADLDAQRDAETEAPAPEGTDQAQGDTPVEAPAPAEDPAESAAKRELRSIKAALREERKARQQLEQRIQAPAPPSSTYHALIDGAPDENQDPIGFMNHMRQKLAALDAQARAEAEAEAQRNAQQGQVQQVVRTMQEFEEDFRADHPDYGDAVEHFKRVRSEEIAASGLSGPALQNAIAQDFLSLAARCFQAGKDPAEVVYNLATRTGFKAGGKNGNVSAVDPQAERLNQIAKGQQQARSLSTGGASPQGGALNYESVSKLEGAAFDAAFEKLRQQERRRA